MDKTLYKQIGFSTGLALVIVAGIFIGVFIGWQLWQSSQSSGGSDITQTTPSQEATVPAGYVEYKDIQGKFKFNYPQTWKTKNVDLDGALVALVRPSLQETTNYEGPLFSLVVSRWDTINTAVRDDSYLGKRSYEDLADFLNDPSAPKKKIGEISVNGQKGFEVINPGIGSQYALLFDRPDGIYEFEFSDVSKKEDLSLEDKSIIESLRFY